MTHDHAQETRVRNTVFLLASAALAAVALVANRPAHAPKPADAVDLAATFAAMALPQPETGCTVDQYNARGGLLAKPKLTCSIQGNPVTRTLHDPKQGRERQEPFAYALSARTPGDVVLLRTVATQTETATTRLYAYSFKTWKFTELPLDQAVMDGDAFFAVSPDGSRTLVAPSGAPDALFLIAPDAKLAAQPFAGAAQGETFVSGAGRIDAEAKIGWKDARTVMAGVYKADALAEVRDLTVE